MLSLLEKFEQIEIKNESRVREKDIEFCEHQEESYRVAIHTWKEAQKLFRSVMNEFGTKTAPYYEEEQNNRVYMSEAEDMSFSKKRITAIKGQFIERICGYFRREYNVSINTHEIKQKYKSNITYKDIIDEIFIQLDGLDFNEKAVQELKDEVRSRLSGSVTNKKITIPHMIYIDSFYKKYDGVAKISYSSNDRIRALFKGLSHFEYGELEAFDLFATTSNVWMNSKGEEVFKKHDFPFEKVKSVKPFQNGKVEITFASMAFAKEFAAEYLN